MFDCCREAKKGAMDRIVEAHQKIEELKKKEISNEQNLQADDNEEPSPVEEFKEQEKIVKDG